MVVSSQFPAVGSQAEGGMSLFAHELMLMCIMTFGCLDCVAPTWRRGRRKYPTSVTSVQPAKPYSLSYMRMASFAFMMQNISMNVEIMVLSIKPVRKVSGQIVFDEEALAGRPFQISVHYVFF